jgi:hypothetical protein
MCNYVIGEKRQWHLHILILIKRRFEIHILDVSATKLGSWVLTTLFHMIFAETMSAVLVVSL